MKVDAGIGFEAKDAAETARRAEEAGFAGIWCPETGHDPFLPLLLAGEHTERLELGTGIAVAFARNPLSMATVANDLQLYSKGRFMLGLGSQIKPHIEKRFSMPWSHPAARMREYVLAMRAIWSAWNEGTKLAFRGEFYKHTLMTPMFSPGPNPYGTPKVFVAGVGELMTEVAGEVGDGFLVHGFTTERYLRDVTHAGSRPGARALGADPRRHRGVLSRDGRHRRHRRADESRDPGGQGTARLLRVHPGVQARARPPRLGRSAARAQHPVQARRMGDRWPV